MSGARPTGALHLGHYVGALKKYGDLQDSGENFFLISDLHFLTTRCIKSEIEKLKKNSIKMVIDTLAIGMSAESTNFYLQSCISEVPYIYAIIQNLVSVSRALATPSLKMMSISTSLYDIPFGLLGYPILEAADIIAMQADEIIVGKDNVDHIAMTNEIIDRFNNAFDTNLKKPLCVTDKHNFVVGLDGKYKMSKSLDNAIFLSDTEDDIDRKISNAPWHLCDEEGVVNSIIQYIEIFSKDKKTAPTINEQFNNKEDVEKKARELAKEIINEELKPIREKIAVYSSDTFAIEKLLTYGTEKAKVIISDTLEYMKTSMGINKWL